MSNFKEVVKESIEKGIILDSCGEVERFYDYGRYIDLCGLDPKDIVENMQNAGTGGGGSSKTNVIINGVVTEDTENEEYYVVFNATSVVLDTITISMNIDGKTQTVTMQPGSVDAKFGPVEKYCEITNVTVTPQSTSVAKYSANVVNPNGKGIFDVSVIKVINNEETLISTEQYKYKDTVNITATDIEGYDFINWDNGIENGDTINIEFEMPEHDVEVRCYYNIKTFTITWLDDDDTKLASTTVNYGDTPVYPNDEPSKVSTQQYDYTFTGWKPTVTAATDNTTYIAEYSSKIRQYTVTWKNYDGEKLTSTTVNYGETPVYPEDGPKIEKPQDDEYTYTFSGWDPIITEVTKDAEYTAQYHSQPRQYEITFTVGDDKVTIPVNYGETPEYPYGRPTMESNNKFDYTFIGWNPVITGVTENTEYTAQFTNTIRKYSLNVEVTNGTYMIEEPTPVVGEFSVSDTEKVVFSQGNLQYNTGNNTWKFADEQYSIIGQNNINIGKHGLTDTVDMFGWSNGSENKFGAIPSNLNEKYEGEFVDWGTLFKGNEEWFTLSKEQWEYLLNTRPNASTLQEIVQIAGVTITGITDDITNINGIMLLPDNWERPENCEPTTIEVEGANVLQYTDEQWSILEKSGAVFLPSAGRRTGGYGNLINRQQEVETNPDNLNEEGYYAFQDNTNFWGYYWTSTVDEENKNVSYAINIKSIGNGDFTMGPMVVWSERGRYGQSVRLVKLSNNDTNMYYEYDQNVTIKATSTNEHYTVEGKEGSGTFKEDTITIKGDTNKIYEFIPNKYTITWKNGNEVLKTEQVEYGTTPSYNGTTPSKAATAQYTYTFNGWIPTVEPVTGDTTYTATFSETQNEYTIEWYANDELFARTTGVTYDKIRETECPQGVPSKPADAQYTYTFNGWAEELNTEKYVVICTAIFSSDINEYTIKFVDEDGTELQKTDVEYGKTPTYTGETPTKAATAQYTYTFDGWTPSIAEVTGDATYTATFSRTVNKYTITWKNGNEVLKTEQVEYGTTPSYNGTTPSKEATEQYTYTFSGWDPEITNETTVTGDITYTATFVETERVYTLTLKDENDVILTGQTIPCGEDISSVLEANNGTIPEGYSVEWINIDNGEKFTSTIMPTDDLTLKRTYKEFTESKMVYYGQLINNNAKNMTSDGLDSLDSFEYVLNEETTKTTLQPKLDPWIPRPARPGSDRTDWDNTYGAVLYIAVPKSVNVTVNNGISDMELTESNVILVKNNTEYKQYYQTTPYLPAKPTAEQNEINIIIKITK